MQTKVKPSALLNVLNRLFVIRLNEKTVTKTSPTMWNVIFYMLMSFLQLFTWFSIQVLQAEDNISETVSGVRFCEWILQYLVILLVNSTVSGGFVSPFYSVWGFCQYILLYQKSLLVHSTGSGDFVSTFYSISCFSSIFYSNW